MSDLVATSSKVRDIVRVYMNAVVYYTFGPVPLTQQEISEVLALGLPFGAHPSLLDVAAQIGALTGGDPSATLAAIRAIPAGPSPLFEGEALGEAVNFAKIEAGRFCVGLGNKIADSVTGSVMIHDADLQRKSRQGLLRDVPAAIEAGKTSRELASELRSSTKDWNRDWERIASTEMHVAHQHGVEEQMKQNFGDGVLAAKIPMSDACSWCRSLYLDSDGKPAIRPLKWFQSNGVTNAGRTRSGKGRGGKWKAVVGAAHPWCQCQLVRVPPGWSFNDDGDLTPGGIALSLAGVEEEDQITKAEALASSQGGEIGLCLVGELLEPHLFARNGDRTSSRRISDGLAWEMLAKAGMFSEGGVRWIQPGTHHPSRSYLFDESALEEFQTERKARRKRTKLKAKRGREDYLADWKPSEGGAVRGGGVDAFLEAIDWSGAVHGADSEEYERNRERLLYSDRPLKYNW